MPDLCVYAETSPPDPEQAPSVPPLAIFEVLSPTDPLDEMFEKADEYLKLGVRLFYVVDTKRRRVLAPDNRGLSVVQGAVSIGPVEIDFNGVLAKLWRD